VEPTIRTVRSPLDGAVLEVLTAGRGPDVVLVQGGGTDVHSYQRLIDRLSRHFTVHAYNRRGRGASAARPAGYNVHPEVADLSGILSDSGAVRVAGHSFGGFVALAGAKELLVERLALFDPAVSVDGSFPSDFLPEFERAATSGDPLDALLIAARGLRNPGSHLPERIQRAAVRMVVMTPPGRTMARLIATVPAEAAMVVAADGSAAQWSGVQTRTRLYIGERSPDYYLPTARALAEAMPDADVKTIPSLGHDAVARAPRSLVLELAGFLA
jgi:pimeloyl-ACP methyl ester carboxylesterase